MLRRAGSGHSLDEAEQLRFVKVGEASRLRVQQAEPRDTRSNRKGLATKPPANGRGQIAARHFVAVMDGARGAERRERARHRPAHPSASLRVGIVRRRPVMTRQEGLHDLQLLQHRSRLTQGRELPREIERHIQRRARQTTATALTICVTRGCVPAVRERGESIEPAEVARLGQRPIERASRLIRQVEGRGFEREVQRRRRPTSAGLAKLVATASSTRSSAAANGSAARGRCRAPRRERLRLQTPSGPDRDKAAAGARSAPVATARSRAPDRRAALRRRATDASSSSRSRAIGPSTSEAGTTRRGAALSVDVRDTLPASSSSSMPGRAAWTRSRKPVARSASVAMTSTRASFRELREQREVHRPQPVGIGDPIGHRDHDAL